MYGFLLNVNQFILSCDIHQETFTRAERFKNQLQNNAFGSDIEKKRKKICQIDKNFRELTHLRFSLQQFCGSMCLHSTDLYSNDG